MQLIPILISLVLISIVQAHTYIKISKPKLNVTKIHHHHHHHHHGHRPPKPNLNSSEEISLKVPEERRKLSLFPKNNKKFVVTPAPHTKHETHKPIVHGKKKPLMKKLNVHHKKLNKDIDNEITERIPKIQARINSNSDVNNKVEVLTNGEIKKIIAEDKSQESIEIEDIKRAKLHNSDKDIKIAIIRPPISKDSIIMSKSKPVEVSPGNKTEERILDTELKKDAEENVMVDLEEFIFVDPAKSTTENTNVSSEESDEYVTIDTPVETKISRRKRGSNVIEEENLATTVAGYKYTWKDTRLNNNLAFKNINS